MGAHGGDEKDEVQCWQRTTEATAVDNGMKQIFARIITIVKCRSLWDEMGVVFREGEAGGRDEGPVTSGLPKNKILAGGRACGPSGGSHF